MKKLLLGTAFLGLAGCAAISSSPAVLKTTGSEQEYERSLGRMHSQLNTREDCELENALITINIGESNKAKEEGKTSYDTNALLDGLTYQQIIELSRKYPAKRLYPCR